MKKFFLSKKGKAFSLIFGFIFIIGLILYAWLLYLVIDYSGMSLENRVDAILVLGHASPGGVPSPWLVERIDTGAYLYHAGYAPWIIVSGGRGPRDDVPVAQIMFYMLTSMGIPEESILIEDNAANTYENFMYAYNITNQHGINSLIVVTNGFHMYRSMMFGQIHFDYLIPVSAEANFNFSLFIAYLREPISIIFNFVRYLI